MLIIETKRKPVLHAVDEAVRPLFVAVSCIECVVWSCIEDAIAVYFTEPRTAGTWVSKPIVTPAVDSEGRETRLSRVVIRDHYVVEELVVVPVLGRHEESMRVDT